MRSIVRMARADAPEGRGGTDAARAGAGRRWLRTDEGWTPGEDAGRLLAAIAVVLAAAAVKLLISHTLGTDLGYLSYLGAVAVAAWIAGLRGGLLATIVSAGVELLLFHAPMGDDLTSSATLLRLGIFLFDGVLVTLLASSLRRASVRERTARAEGETHLEALAAAHDAAERGRAALARFQALTASLATAATPNEVADAILDHGLPALGASAGLVIRLDDEGRTVEALAVRGDPGAALADQDPSPSDLPPPVRDALETRLPHFPGDPVGPVAGDPERAAGGAPWIGPDGGSMAVLPLLSADRTLGAVVFWFEPGLALAEGTRDEAARIVHLGAQALDRAVAYDRELRAREALERGQARLVLLAGASEHLGSGWDLGASASALAASLVPTLADWCAIELLDPERPTLARAGTGDGSVDAIDELATLARRSLGSWLAPDTAGGDAAILPVRASWSERLTDQRAVEILDRLDTRSLLVAPIPGTDERPLGSIVLGGSRADRFGPGDRAFAQGLAARIASAAAQGRLFEAVARFKATVDMSADAVYMFDPQTLRLTYVNRGGANLAGSAPDGLLGIGVLELQKGITEPDFRQRLAALRASASPSTAYTEVLARRDGGEVPVEVLLQEVTLPDGGRTAILTARDISDRIDVQARLARIAGDERRQAAELRAVIQAMGEGVLVLDPAGQVSLANEAAGLILGSDLPTGLAEIESRLALAPGDLGEASGTPEGTGHGDGPRTVLLDDGRWLEISAYPVDLGGGVADGMAASRIVVVRDVTRARDADAAREAFLGVLSHELRTPVTTIFGYAKVLQRRAGREDQGEMLKDIEVEADRLYRIVEDLLALSRVEGGITIEGEPLLIQHLSGAVIASEARRWEGIAFETHLPADLPPVFGERTYVEQVLRNLTSNAGKYSPPDTSVTIEAEATPTEVVIRVLDRGIGIDADEAERLFGLYYRSPNTARTAAGAGIGLYVARGLISAMGGRIWARPRPEGGSEFGFSLPRCEEDPAPPEAWPLRSA